MFKSIQTVLMVVCVVTLSHHVQLGKSHNDVMRIAAAVVEALLPTLNEMKSELNCIKATVDLLNETVSQQDELIRCVNETVSQQDELIRCVNETVSQQDELIRYVNETVSQQDELIRCVNETVSQQDELIRCVNETVSQQDELIRYVNETVSQQDELIRCVNETVKTLAGEFEEHRNETASQFVEIESKLAVTQASIQSHIDNPATDEISRGVLLMPYLNNIEQEIKTDIGQKIDETATSTEIILRDAIINQTTSELADLQSSMSADLSCIKTDLADLQSSVDSVNDILNDINETNTDQLMQICVKLDFVQSTIDSVNTQEFSSINELSEITNEIVDKIEDHDTEITDKLADIEILISDTHDDFCTCGGTGGWRRVVHLDMTDPDTDCPSGWNMTNYFKRTCGRASDAYDTCDSVFFSVSGGEYGQVCGKIKAYQSGWTPGFWGYNYRGQTTIDQAYLSGVAVMHGSPRQHIWSFVAGGAENYESDPGVCPCDISRFSIPIPPFVGNDYFCESGYISLAGLSGAYTFHGDDPLWDGDGCHSTSACCEFNNPPYFTKHLNTTTTDDIELRMCHYRPARGQHYEEIAVELVELYVK